MAVPRRDRVMRGIDHGDGGRPRGRDAHIASGRGRQRIGRPGDPWDGRGGSAGTHVDSYPGPSPSRGSGAGTVGRTPRARGREVSGVGRDEAGRSGVPRDRDLLTTKERLAERVLSTRELNRALLARQLLLERSSLPLTRALERVAGLQSQYAPSAYIGLWTRLRDFRREALSQALAERRVVHGTLMRVTIHLVSARDYPLCTEGIRKSRREWWLRVQRHQVEGLDMEEVGRLLR